MAATAAQPPVIPPLFADHPTVFAPRLQFVLLGDSLTQNGTEPIGWATLLAHHYARKADIVNRGYSGYNTNHALALLRVHIAEGVWPTTHAQSTAEAQAKQPPAIVTLFFGANDACLPESISDFQAVDVAQYKQNLLEMVRLLKGADGQANPNVRVLLIGPPQVDSHAWGRACMEKHKLATPPITRSLAHTQLYADAARSLAQELSLPFVNCWSFTGDLVGMFRDGLHFSAKGNYKLFKVVRLVIGQNWPKLAAEQRPLDSFPFLQIKTKTKEGVDDIFDSHLAKQKERERKQQEQKQQQQQKQ